MTVVSPGLSRHMTRIKEIYTERNVARAHQEWAEQLPNPYGRTPGPETSACRSRDLPIDTGSVP